MSTQLYLPRFSSKDPQSQGSGPFGANESGFALILFALVIFSAVGIGGMILDHGKQELAVEELQRAADAAALAGARQLNSQPEGWRRAKKAALVAIKSNPIHGLPSNITAGLKLTSGGNSFWDDNASLPSSVAPVQDAPLTSNPGVTGHVGPNGLFGVTVERGLYWANSDGTGSFRFISLDGAPEVDAKGRRFSAPTYIIANAVRVTVTLNELPTTFGNIFGLGSFTNLTRTSIAIMDRESENEVLPIAIPLCQLFAEIRPGVTSGSRELGRYKPELACKRRTLATEMNAAGDLDYADPNGPPSISNLSYRRLRDEAFARWRAFNRPSYTNFNGGPNVCFTSPFSGSAHNCAELDLFATLGLPSDTPNSEVNNAAEIANAFSTPPTARTGQFFKPLKDLGALRTDATLRRTIAEAIKNGNHSVAEKITDGQAPKELMSFLRTEHINPPKYDPQGRPFIGGQSPQYYDLQLRMPTIDGGISKPTVVIAQDMKHGGLGHLNYTNPLCHDENLRYNDPSARVLRRRVMIVAPGIEKFEDNFIKYCDFAAVFSGSDQEAFAPDSGTQPTVVGTIDVYLSDFNFADLDAKFPKQKSNNPMANGRTTSTPVFTGMGPGTLEDRNPYGLDMSGDDKSLLGDLKSQTKSFLDKYDAFANCRKKKSYSYCKKNFERPSLDIEDNGLVPIQFRRCFDFRGIEDDIEAIMDCGKKPSCSGSFVLSALISALRSELEDPVPSNSHMHCIPVMRPGKYDKNDAASYRPLQSIRAGVGCGGLFGKVSCSDTDLTIPTGKNWTDNQPALVEVR